MPPDLSDAEYLGDGLYASYDGYHIWLTTQRHDGWHAVALEPAVYEALTRFHAVITAPGRREAGGER